MNKFFLIVFVAFWGTLTALPSKESRNPTLRLVHVLYRHGDRNPDNGSLIAGSAFDNERFYPEGWGQLTNAGKRTEYKIGQLLRKRYDNFLTDTWNINYLDVRTTNVNRTKMSAQLMLAGLYPPTGDQMWSDLLWQPIPYNYYATSEDKETAAWSACSRWAELYAEILASNETTSYLERYEELFSILAARTGASAGIAEAFNYYFGLAVTRELGYPLARWTRAIFPEPMHSAAVDYYYLITNNTAIRRIFPGYLLRKILTDTASKINGTISPSSRKMFIYSAHEMNVASMVLGLDAFKLTDVPPYGAHVLFEIHEISGVWGIKLFFQNYDNEEPYAIKLPGCDYFCPYDQFYSLVEEILPDEDVDCSGS